MSDFIISDRTRFLIGVVIWSLYDLRLLDALDTALSNGNRTERVDVFDIDSCQTKEELSVFIPNIGKVLQPPIVGVWHNGLQIKQASGALGRDILVKAFALSNDEIISLAHRG